MTRIKKKILNWTLLSVFVILLTGGIAGYKMYTKPHRNVKETKATALEAPVLASAYENNEPEANSKYLDKVLEVTGEIKEITKNQKGETVIALKGTDMSTVRCSIEGDIASETKTGTSVALKGICTGFLTDVVLVRCILINR